MNSTYEKESVKHETRSIFLIKARHEIWNAYKAKGNRSIQKRCIIGGLQILVHNNQQRSSEYQSRKRFYFHIAQVILKHPTDSWDFYHAIQTVQILRLSNV